MFTVSPAVSIIIYLHHLFEMIVVAVPIIVLIPVGVEQEFSRSALEEHAGAAPEVGGTIVVQIQNHLRRPVLTGLDVLVEIIIWRKWLQASTGPDIMVPRRRHDIAGGEDVIVRIVWQELCQGWRGRMRLQGVGGGTLDTTTSLQYNNATH